MIHGKRSNGKAHGVVNTKASVVSKMLDLVNYSESRNLSSVHILEPAAGEGAFAMEVISRLFKSSQKFDFCFEHSLSNIHICELHVPISQILKANITNLLNDFGIHNSIPKFHIGDFLQLDIINNFDLIIGNPPYVRNENIPKTEKLIYQRNFSTFTHRSDLYIPFYEKSLSLLKSNGLLSFVCSNRWLKNQYGKSLRRLITSEYRIESIIDLESADIFEEEVLGYPAITNISNKKKKDDPPYYEIKSLDKFIEFKSNSKITSSLNLSSPNWFSQSYDKTSYGKNLSTIENQGFKIGIGVATGRDSIFIGKSFDEQIEEEVLLPIITSKGVKGETINWQGNYLINPFDQNGNLIDLNDFPETSKYFNRNKEELSKRHTAKKDLRKFYKTIDKVHYQLTMKPKVLLPDISSNRFIHVDNGKYYPHHNLYHITGGNYKDMCLLAAILMSDFIYNQLLQLGNKMKGGYPRWQSQNLRKLYIPRINSIPYRIKESLLLAYSKKDLVSINKIITEDRISEFKITEGQAVLFEPSNDYIKKTPNSSR